MKRVLRRLGLTACVTAFLTSCSYNPFISDNHTTGSATGAAIGAGAGAGAIALVNGPKPLMAAAALGGGAIGYYVTTLRYDAGGVYHVGGQVYKLGKFVGINIPTDALFEMSTADFLPDAHYVLDSAVNVLLRYPDNNIIISGNTSGFGRPKREKTLSLKRARAVSAYLWNAGINDFKSPNKMNDMRKLNYVGYGDYFPITDNDSLAEIRKNSRIQIISYPSNEDLRFTKQQSAFDNIGSMKDAAEDKPEARPGCLSDLEDC